MLKGKIVLKLSFSLSKKSEKTFIASTEMNILWKLEIEIDQEFRIEERLKVI
jgi:hypothetical protein